MIQKKPVPDPIGKGGDTWVSRQERTDITLAPVTDALLAFAAPGTGERAVDTGCGWGATTLAFGHAIGPSGREFMLTKLYPRRDPCPS